MAWRMRLAGMRSLIRLFLLSLFLLAAGCLASKAAPDSALTPDAVASPYQAGSPLETTADAVTVAFKTFKPGLRVLLSLPHGQEALLILHPSQWLILSNDCSFAIIHNAIVLVSTVLLSLVLLLRFCDPV